MTAREWQVDGEPYPCPSPDHPDAWEYMCTLMHLPCSEIVDGWDSSTETANGMQFLNKQDCLDAVVEIQRYLDDGGDPHDWFTVEHVCPVDKGDKP